MSSRRSNAEPERRRTGRRPGPSTTREEILAAARESFAKRGYEGTSLRAVAARAGVDPALVRRFFHSKEGLLEAALDVAMRPGDQLNEVVEGDITKLGEQMIGYMLSVWSKAPNRQVMVGMLSAACTNRRGAKLLRQFITNEVLRRLGSKLDPGEAQLRASLVGSQLLGLALYRYVVKIEPLASASEEELRTFFAPTLQRYLTGGLYPAPPRRPRKQTT
jgi:AcrR family transcriptional regulator